MTGFQEHVRLPEYASRPSSRSSPKSQSLGKLTSCLHGDKKLAPLSPVKSPLRKCSSMSSLTSPSSRPSIDISRCSGAPDFDFGTPVRKQSVHTTSYADLLSPSWKPTRVACVPLSWTCALWDKKSLESTKNHKGLNGTPTNVSAVELDLPQVARKLRPQSGLRLAPLQEKVAEKLATTLDHHVKGALNNALANEWASQTLQSLKKSQPISEEVPDVVSTTCSESDALSLGVKSVTVESERSCKEPEMQLRPIQGAPNFTEALERLELGYISAGESSRASKAFSRFSAGEEDFDRACLDQVLNFLGYAFDEDVVDVMAAKVTDMQSFDLGELMLFLEEYAAAEKDIIQSAFTKKACAHGENRSSISISELPVVMKDLQITICRDTYKELLQRAGFVGKTEVNGDEVARVVAAYRVSEGFTENELSEAHEAFESEAVDGRLTADDLPNALIGFFGVHCIKPLRELLEVAGTALADSTVPVHVHEFLIWARRLKNAQLSELYGCFDQVDKDGDGAISFAELRALMKQEGFTLSSAEAHEFLVAAELEGSHDRTFSFDDAVEYLSACRESEGFSSPDLEELTAVYNRFDTEGEGEITTLQVLDLLRYLGYQVSVEEVEDYAKAVDFNGNGTMDMDEYLRLMRLHREDEIDTVDKVFHKLVSTKTGLMKLVDAAKSRKNASKARLPIGKLHDALRECKCCPSHCDVFDELRRDMDSTMTDLSFEEFKLLADKARKSVKQTQKKKANFPDEEFKILEVTFKHHDVTSRGFLDKTQLQILLHQCGIPFHTADARQVAMETLDKARQAALDAEISPQEVGNFGNFSATFWVMVQVWRIVARDNECKNIARVDEARAAASFSAADVDEFQKVFSNWVKHGPGQNEPTTTNRWGRIREAVMEQGRRRSVPDISEAGTQELDEMTGTDLPSKDISLESILGISTVNEQLAFADLKNLLGGLKLKLSPTSSWTLHEKVQQLTGGDYEGALDLANFLYLMRWMLDTNFANLNNRTASVAKSLVAMSPTAPDGDTEKHAPAQPQPALGRRCSI